MGAIIVKDFQEQEASKAHPFLGWRFAKPGKLCGDKKCDYCGKYFSWDSANIERYILERRWEGTKKEPVHCNSTHCQDYHNRWLVHMKRLKENPEYREANYVQRKSREGYDEKKVYRLYQRLKQQGLVA